MTVSKVECIVCSSGKYPTFSLGKDLCEDHDVCISCGIKRANLKQTPWGSRFGAFQCAPCETSKRKEQIKKRIAKGFEHECTDDVVCPYCGYTHGDSWEFQDGEHICQDCERLFILEQSVSVTYTTEKMKDKK